MAKYEVEIDGPDGLIYSALSKEEYESIIKIISRPKKPPKRIRKYNRKCGVCSAIFEQGEMVRTDESPNGWLCESCFEEYLHGQL